MAEYAPLFLDAENFDASGDIEELSDKIEQILPYRALKATQSYNDYLGRYREELLRNICSARASILMHMSLTDDFDFFDKRSPDDMFKFLSDSPPKSIKHLSPRISQALSLLLTRIHKNVDEFVSLACRYFSDDISFILIFSYSTFPALFGFFTLDHFCERGGYFIRKMMEDDRMAVAVSGMVGAYFFSMYAFFDILWNAFLEGVSNDKSLDRCKSVFLDVLNKNMQFLTADHALVISLYLNKNVGACSSVVFQDVFAASLRLRDPSMVEFIEFLESCASANGDGREYAETVFHILTKDREYVSLLPPLPSFDDLRRLPFAMSDRDIWTICQIEESSTDSVVDARELFKALPTFLERRYAPFFVELVNPHAPRQKPPHRDLTPEEMSNKRNITNLVTLAQNTKTDVVSWLAKTRFFVPRHNVRVPEFCWSERFNQFALVHQCNSICEGITQTTNVIDLIGRTRYLQSYSKFIDATYNRLLDKFAETYVASIISNIKVSRSLGTIERLDLYFKGVIKQLDSRLALPACLAILDSAKAPFDEHMAETEQRLRNLLSRSTFDERVGIWASAHPRVAIALKQKCDEAFRMPLGSRLRVMIWLGELLKNIITTNETSYMHWQHMFENILCLLSREAHIFSSFAIWNRLVFMNTDLLKILPKKQVSVLNELLAGFATLIRCDESKFLYNAFAPDKITC